MTALLPALFFMAIQSGKFLTHAADFDMAASSLLPKGWAHQMCAPTSQYKGIFAAATLVGVTFQQDNSVPINPHEFDSLLNDLTVAKLDGNFIKIKVGTFHLDLLQQQCRTD
ncbi:MAG: hypothetical protein ABIO31_03215 [Candidatus Nitrotoga sp.]